MKSLSQVCNERYYPEELKSFNLRPADKKIIESARAICQNLRREYDRYGGRLRDTVMVGAAKVLEGTEMLLWPNKN